MGRSNTTILTVDRTEINFRSWNTLVARLYTTNNYIIAIAYKPVYAKPISLTFLHRTFYIGLVITFVV